MDKCLRPQIFDIDANSEEGPRKWLLWKRTFESFIRRIDRATDRDNLDLLINFIDTNVYLYIAECITYADALNKLECAYVKPVNELRLNHVFNKARSLHEAQKNAEFYQVRHGERIATVSFNNIKIGQPQKENKKRRSGFANFKYKNCTFCGGSWHKHADRPNRMGHFVEVCSSKVKKIPKTLSTACEDEEHSYISALINLIGDEKVNVIVLVNGVRANCLIDTGAKFNHIDSKFCQRAKLNYEESSEILKLELAVKNSAVKTKGLCSISVGFQGRDYNNVKFLVLKNLLWNVILDCEFLSLHKSVKIDFGEPGSSLKLGALSTLRGIKPVRLFKYLSPNIRPIATKRRGYSSTDLSFISGEISRLLADNIIEPSKLTMAGSGCSNEK